MQLTSFRCRLGLSGFLMGLILRVRPSMPCSAQALLAMAVGWMRGNRACVDLSLSYYATRHPELACSGCAKPTTSNVRLTAG